MDKNMINIDDLLKQRLTGGEEKERPGAWLQMRDLLDKEMPVTGPLPGSSMNWRRMFGYLSALVLISAVSVGGYQMATSNRPEYKPNEGVAANLPATHITGSNAGTGAVPSAAKNTASAESPALNKDTAIPHNPFRKKNKIKATSTAASGKNTANTTKEVAATDNKTQQNTTTGTAANNNNEVTATTAKESKLLSDSRKKALSAAVNTTNNKKQVVTVDNTTKHNKTQQAAAEQAPKDRQYASATKLGKTKDSALKTAVRNAKNNAANTAKNTTNHNNAVVASGTAANTTETKPAVQPDYTLGKKTISTLQVRQSYTQKDGKKVEKIDTISTGKAEMDVLTPILKDVASNNPTQPSAPNAHKQPTITVKDEIVANNSNGNSNDIASNSNVVPASAMSLNANKLENGETLVPLANYKVSSKQQGSNYDRTNLIEQMIQNAKVNVGTAKFYGGVIGGLNSSLSGNNSMWGFQLGLSGLLSLNERWGVVSELKFMQRFNNKAISNNGYANLDSSAATGSMVYTWDSVNRSFTFPTVSAIELPVYIKYSLNRLNFHAGMNLTYNFSIKNIDMKEFTIRQTNNEGPVMEGAVNYSFDNGVPKIEVADFSSRFSMGYLFGVGYQLSPALQVDVRMTKAFTDNAKTDGAKELSKRVFNNPTVQVNLNYRFSNNKFKPYRK
jgi:hypothetical protein